MPSIELQHQVEQFLFREARLLDEGQFYDWLDLFTDDAEYWMPTRDTVERDGVSVHGVDETALFRDDKDFLVMRVRRFDTGLAHAEQPPSRTRHLVSNVEIVREHEEELEVHANIIVFQSRLESTECFFVGKREDRLRRHADSWRIASRKIVLDQTLMPRALSIFF